MPLTDKSHELATKDRLRMSATEKELDQMERNHAATISEWKDYCLNNSGLHPDGAACLDMLRLVKNIVCMSACHQISQKDAMSMISRGVNEFLSVKCKREDV